MSLSISQFSFSTRQPGWRERAVRLRGRVVASWREAQARRQLATLDDRALSDIGISRAQARFESERPVWELLPHLHR